MNNYSVFHSPTLVSIRGPKLISYTLENFPNYRKMATVKCNDLGEVYNLTNSHEGPWWTNEGVELHVSPKHGCRSTSVGDVIIYTEDNVMHVVVVDSFGFTPIPFK